MVGRALYRKQRQRAVRGTNVTSNRLFFFLLKEIEREREREREADNERERERERERKRNEKEVHTFENTQKKENT
jgi:hypothetical protein